MRINTEGITHEESLVQPQPAGNCLNWVAGHLLCIYNNVLPLVGEKPVMDESILARYDRGSAALKNPGEALQLSDILAACDEATRRLEAGLSRLSPEQLDAPAPFSPSKNPNETVRSLLGVVTFHQAYHSGQLGLLRRIIGKPGAIA
jgi:hypothetical protein